jgi:hypothetical protein
MSKKLIAALMALAAFAAFAVSATSASAAPVVTHPTGTPMAVHPAGTTCTAEPQGCIDATNIGETRFTSSTLEVKCTTATLTGDLTTNSTAAGFAGDITTATFSGTGTNGGCTASGSFFTGTATPTPGIPGGLPWCLKNAPSGDNFEIRGGLCSEASRGIKFALDLGSFVTCTYERSSLTGTFVTDISGQDLTGSITAGQAWTLLSGFGCPSAPTLDMEFTLETDTSPASPIFISS